MDSTRANARASPPALSAATQSVRVTAIRTGAFRVTFDELTPGRRDLVRVVVVRRAGTNLVLKRLPRPACMPDAFVRIALPHWR